MDIFSRTYLKILEETLLTSFSELDSKDFAKSNGNFPEGEDLDITSYLNLPKRLKVILPKHCIKSESEKDIHGFNYLELTKQQCINCISNALNELIAEVPIDKLLKIRSCNFAVICIDKNTNAHYRLAFKTKSNSSSIVIYLKTIFKSDKKTFGTGNSHGYFEQTFLKDIIFERSKVNQAFELKSVYF